MHTSTSAQKRTSLYLKKTPYFPEIARDIAYKELILFCMYDQLFPFDYVIIPLWRRSNHLSLAA